MVKRARSVIPSAARDVGAPALAVDDTEGVLDHGALRPQVLGRQHHLPARGDDVLDDQERAPGDVAPLRRSARCRTSSAACGRRTPAARSPTTAWWPAAPRRARARRVPRSRAGTSGHQRLDDVGQQDRVGLEAVLVEVVVGRAARAQDERAGQVGGGEDAGGQRHPPILHGSRAPGIPAVRRQRWVLPPSIWAWPGGSEGGRGTGSSWPTPSWHSRWGGPAWRSRRRASRGCRPLR